jgi:riboflavin synthase
MFTGLVEAVGAVEESRSGDNGALHLRVCTGLADLLTGESVAVNGVCLTVTTVDGDTVQMDIGPETARVTSLGAIRQGTRVNLERAIRADGRFGGHLVQGHVDGIGVVEDIRIEDEAHWLKIGFSRVLTPYLVHRGAVAVDGISLTVAELGEEWFDVMVVPFTWTHTNLSTVGIGGQVNLECDVVGKYVVRAVRTAGADINRTTVAD